MVTLRLLPGASAEAAADALDRARDAARRTLEQGRDGAIVSRYVAWVGETVNRLRHSIAAEDVDRLVATPRFWMIAPLATASAGFHAQELIAGELEARIAELTSQSVALRSAARPFEVADWIVVPDTNVWLHTEGTLDEMPWRRFAPCRDLETVIVLIPLVVVDELDKKKRDGSKREDLVTVRTRARESLKLINTAFSHPTNGWQIDAAATTGGQTIGRLWIDSPSHRRLPEPDLEIIDVTSQVAALSGRRTILVTRDTGMELRAKAAGVQTRNLTLEPLPPAEP